MPRNQRIIARLSCVVLCLFAIGLGGDILGFQQSVQAQEVRAQENIIKFGVVLGLTGRSADISKVEQDAIELWKDTVNAKGGIKVGGKSHKVVVKYYDDGGDSTATAELTEKLIVEDGIKFIVGPPGSGPTRIVAEVVGKHKVPMVAPLASSDSLFDGSNRWIFGMLIHSAKHWEPMLQAILNRDPKPKTLALITLDTTLPLSAAENASDTAKRLGLQVVYFVKFPPGVRDHSSSLLVIRGRNPDVLVTIGYLRDTMRIAEEIKKLKVRPKYLIMSPGPDAAHFITELKDAANYITAPALWFEKFRYKGPVFGTAEDYARLFKERYDYKLGYPSAACSNAMIVFQKAIEKANSLDPAKVRDAIASLDITTFYGPLKYNEEGRNVGAVIATIQVLEGEQTIVWPPATAAKDLVYPIPWPTPRPNPRPSPRK